MCEAVSEAWRERRDEVLEHAGRLTEAIDEQVMRPDVQVDLSPQLLREAYDNVAAAFEPNYGGFGSAPKFPPSMTLEFLLRAYDRNASPQTLEMITTTLDAMAAGGMYDQVGGGFARYSTDDYWLVPHFEKMLYDNALLTRAYLHAYLVTGKPRYKRIVEETIEYVMRDLRHPEGGFFSAEDADSEGIEGKFYLWSVDEITEVCGDDADALIRYYGVTEAGNFIDPHTQYSGNILHIVDRTAEPSDAVLRARDRLLTRRALRIRPGLDNKVLLAWNALFLQSLDRSRGCVRPGRLAGCGPEERSVPPHADEGCERPLRPLLAGAVPRVRRGLRRTARGAVFDGRARQRVVARLRPARR